MNTYQVSAKHTVRALLLIGVLAISGCATRSTALLLPIEQAPVGGSKVDILTITTRAPSLVPGEVYSGERSRELSGRVIKVSIPPSHQRGRVELPSGKKPDPQNEFAALSVQTTTPEGAWDWFEQQETQGRVLFFVHGYNVRFADAVFSLAQITNDLPVIAAPVLFSWPSRGELIGYIYDRESATYARDAFETVLTKAIESERVSQITILAHSMGSWITMETLRQMSIRHGRVSDKVADVILAAPDLDIDVFEQQFLALGTERPHFTFIVSADDRALGLSKMLARGEQRVGSIDPSKEPYRSRINATPGVAVIDLSAAKGTDSALHSKFSGSQEMLDFARRTMSENAEAVKERTSVGELAGAVIVTLGLGVAKGSE